jgi:hypothetical protein
MPTALSRAFILLLACLALSACSGRGLGTPVAQECNEGLRLGNQELEDAKVKGFSGSIQWIKAANLLAAASVQQQLERFESCADKVRRARLYIKEARK